MQFSTLVDIIILGLFLGMAIILVAVLAHHRKVIIENDSLRETVLYYEQEHDCAQY